MPWPAARPAVVGLALAAVACLAGCGSAPLPSGSPPPSRPAGPPSATPARSSTAPTPSPTAPSPTATAAGIPYDESLLDVFPATIAGLELVSTPEIAGELGGDPQMLAIAQGYAAGVIADQASGELAVAMVIRLRDGIYKDAFFRDYRDSFDAAACTQAGGLVGNAEAEIGGYQTFIATCENGARTYHVHVEQPDMLVSITAVGDRLRLGEAVVEALPD